jgi:hypothetical protein
MGDNLRRYFYRTSPAMIILLFTVFFISMRFVVAQAVPDNTLYIFEDKDYFILNVASPIQVNLTDLHFKPASPELSVVYLGYRFPSLALNDNLAEPGTCFIFKRDNSTPTYPEACSNPALVFVTKVARSDVFWYDGVRNDLLDIIPLGVNDHAYEICSSEAPHCEFVYESTAPDNESSDVPNPLPMPSSGPCVLTTRYIQSLNIRSEHNTDSAILGKLDINTRYAVIEQAQDIGMTWWYHIQVNISTQGWVVVYLTKSGGLCDNLPSSTAVIVTPPLFPPDAGCLLATFGNYRVLNGLTAKAILIHT